MWLVRSIDQLEGKKVIQQKFSQYMWLVRSIDQLEGKKGYTAEMFSVHVASSKY